MSVIHRRKCAKPGIPGCTGLGTLCHGWTHGQGVSRNKPERLGHRFVTRCRQPAQPYRCVRRKWCHPHQFAHCIQEQPLRSRSDSAWRGYHRLWRRRVVLGCRQHHRALHAFPHGCRGHKGQGLRRHCQRTEHDIRPLLVCMGTGRELLHQLGQQGDGAQERNADELDSGPGTDDALGRRTDAGREHHPLPHPDGR